MIKLMKYAKGYVLQTVLAPITIILEVIFEVFIPYLMSIIVDYGIMGDVVTNSSNISLRVLNILQSMGVIGADSIVRSNYVAIASADRMDIVLFVGGTMVIFALLALLFGVMSGIFSAQAGNGFAKNIRNAIFKKVQEFSFANVDKFSTASLVTRSTADITNVQQSFQMIIRICFRSPIMLVFAIYMVIQTARDLSLILLIAVPVLAFGLGLIAVKAMKHFRYMFGRYDDMNLAVQENLISIRVVKAYVREDHESEKFRQRTEELKQAQVKAEKTVIWNGPLMFFSMYACMITIYAISGVKIVAGEMTSGQLTSALSMVNQVLNSLMMISMIFVMLLISRASVNRIKEVLNEKIDITDENADENLRVMNGDISIKNVNFSYTKKQDNLTLTNINLDIKSGETVGIIGGTGSGKSSLVQLIPRLYDVFDGEITVGGHNVKNYTLNNLRESVAMVLQKNVLFSGTIEENLKWGNSNASQEELEWATNIAQAHKFIMGFNEGYNTYLEQGGVNVSGGQKQRLCIARALLKKPKILILDDSTSAVDTATDISIREGLKRELKDMTVIIIAQRINSIMHADKIVVLDEGKIDAVGTHKELIESNEIYKEVFYSQNSSLEEAN